MMRVADLWTLFSYYSMVTGCADSFGLLADDRLYISMPLYHTAAGIIGIGQMLLRGNSCVIRLRFSASNFWRDCVQHECTVRGKGKGKVEMAEKTREIQKNIRGRDRKDRTEIRRKKDFINEVGWNVQASQYIGEICRYLLAQPLCEAEKRHKVRLMFGKLDLLFMCNVFSSYF